MTMTIITQHTLNIFTFSFMSIFPCFCSFNTSKNVKVEFIEFVILKAFFMQEPDPSFQSISMSIQKTFRSVSVECFHFTFLAAAK